MQDINKILTAAEATCTASGSRLTDKRKQVLSCLLESPKAQSAYDLIHGVQERYGATMQPTTMYRILDFLESENLVHKLQLANKYISCSHISCDHSHEVPQFLICNQCDRVVEIGVKSELISSLTHSVEQVGYTLVSPQLELDCLCSDCAAPTA